MTDQEEVEAVVESILGDQRLVRVYLEGDAVFGVARKLVQAAREPLLQRIQELEEAVRKYGSHIDAGRSEDSMSCRSLGPGNNRSCTCGFAAFSKSKEKSNG